MDNLIKKITEKTKLQKNILRMCVFLFLSTFLVYSSSFFLAPFNDWDVSFYPVIGRGIFEHHLLPYNYLFDHKPYLVYVLYYLWCRVEPLVNGRFMLLTLACAGMTSFFLGKVYKASKWRIFIFFCLFSAFCDYFDGNTEVIQAALISLFVYLITKSLKLYEDINLFLSGCVLSFSSNINYLSGFILALISGAFFICTNLNFRRISWFLFGIISSLFVIFLPFFVMDHGNIVEYFFMQHHFLHNYASSFRDRIAGIAYLFCDLLFLLPILISWVAGRYFFSDIKYKVLSFWFVFAVLATALSGHGYTHYFSLFYVPAIMMLVILYHDGKLKYPSVLIPFILYVEISMILAVISNVNSMKHTARENPALVTQLVGHEKVLNINSDHSLYYLANLEPFEKFSFQGQMEIYYKDNYNDMYMKDLMDKPKFVILPYRGCVDDTVDKSICSFILKNYKLDFVSYSKKNPNNNSGRYYELYELLK